MTLSPGKDNHYACPCGDALKDSSRKGNKFQAASYRRAVSKYKVLFPLIKGFWAGSF
jgi:hypothetical protein